MYHERHLGRWTFVYRNPYKSPWYWFRAKSHQTKVSHVFSFWRFAIWRRR